jgi:hypothetical protein
MCAAGRSEATLQALPCFAPIGAVDQKSFDQNGSM